MASKEEIKKRQCLLYVVDGGYYVGEIDGIWGTLSKTATRYFKKDFGLADNDTYDAETEKALRHAVAYGMPARKQETVKTGDFWDGVKWFKQKEFACKDGCGADEMNETLIRVADRVRDHFGSPVIVSSGRRCATHNAKVGGVSNSRHLSGKAMDFCVRGKTSSVVLAYVQKQPEIRYAYSIDGSYVHMDVN
jgi:hypothetical protein